MSSPTPPVPDPSLLGRMFLLLRAVLRDGTATTDDCLLPGERHGKRHGNPKLLGIATAQAHRNGWIRPLPARQVAARLSRKSVRTARADGAVTLWTRTDTTAAAFEQLKRQLTTPPPRRGLFDDCD